jgi:hypothetical protein
MNRLELTWLAGESKGTTDVFAAGEFDAKCARDRRCHIVRGVRGYIGAATYDLSVTDRAAVLDYAAYPAENTDAGMLAGVLRLTFRDKGRNEVQRVDWKDPRSGRFSRANVLWRWTMFELFEYKPRRGSTRTKRAIKERPGQVKFRAELMQAYGNRCCITDCPVAAALEGAHIDPFENATHDHPTNGILLRRDLHRLFDVDLVAVNPRTMRVEFAPELRLYRPYRELHGRRVRLPLAGLMPDEGALARRFRTYQSRA